MAERRKRMAELMVESCLLYTSDAADEDVYKRQENYMAERRKRMAELMVESEK
ncbi:hypothetical protein AZZ75_002098 [Klebsiella pneumoniae]|nr:hypothetical protein AZZ75_002098 [Klebsiella pneumoniae]